MDHPRFVIEAGEAESMAKSSGVSVPELLPRLVKSAQTLARPPTSNYHVAAVGLSSDGRIFIGVNLEFPGVPLHHSVHAEQFLVTNHAFHNSPRLVYIAVSSAPCGHCRQFLQELRKAGDIQILITSEAQKDVIYKPLLSLLPNPFGPCDLLDQETPLILEDHNNGLCLMQNKSLSNGVGQDCEKLKTLALEAANDSHAPYSHCPSGVALMDVNGRVYKGCYMESAAYNPSLGPVQAALVAFVASGGGGSYDEIVAAVVVEKEGAVVRQEDTARLLLKMVSPNCDFRVFHCCSSLNGCV